MPNQTFSEELYDDAALKDAVDRMAEVMKTHATKAYVDEKVAEAGGESIDALSEAIQGLNQAINTKQDKTQYEQTIAQMSARINAKQDQLQFDDEPTENSENLVNSGVVYEAIEESETRINNSISKSIPYVDQNTVEKITKDGTTFIISEKEPRRFVNKTGDDGTIHGINRFNIATATFAMSGSSASYTITKEANGIKIETTITNTTSHHYAYANYTAEFTGLLYLSCDAELINGKVDTLLMRMKVNDVTVESVYGTGKLFVAANVTAGDIINLCFYGHNGEGEASTSLYKNIMLSYGGLYPFTPYKPDAGTGDVQNVYNSIILNDVIDAMNYSSSFKWVFGSGYLSDAFSLPLNNDTIAEDIIIESDEAIPVRIYNELAFDQNMTGIAVSQIGNLAFRIAGMNKTGMRTWLQSHQVIIRYKVAETSTGSDISPEQFQQGVILSYTNQQHVEYLATKRISKGTLVCFGDSITGMFSGKSSYTDIISMISDYDVINCGFSGTGYTDHSSAAYRPFSANRLIEACISGDYALQDASTLVDPESSSYNPLYAEHLSNLKNIDFKSVDYVSFFYGTNDWGSNKILNSADDSSTDNKQRTNVEDALKYCVTQLLTKYPHLRLIVVTPYWRNKSGSEDSNINPNENNVYLYEFSDKIKEIAQKSFNLPVVDLYYSYGANALTNRYFTKDGTHPTERGKRIIAKRIIDCLDNY